MDAEETKQAIALINSCLKEHDVRLDKIEAESLKRTTANRRLILKKARVIQNTVGVLLSTIGFMAALYLGWAQLNDIMRSQLAYKLIEGAIPLTLGAAGFLFVRKKDEPDA